MAAVFWSVLGCKDSNDSFPGITLQKFSNLLRKHGKTQKRLRKTPTHYLREVFKKILHFRRTTPDAQYIFFDAEKIILTFLLPSFCGSPVADHARRLDSLTPGRSTEHDTGYSASLAALEPLGSKDPRIFTSYRIGLRKMNALFKKDGRMQKGSPHFTRRQLHVSLASEKEAFLPSHCVATETVWFYFDKIGIALLWHWWQCSLLKQTVCWGLDSAELLSVKLAKSCPKQAKEAWKWRGKN